MSYHSQQLRFLHLPTHRPLRLRWWAGGGDAHTNTTGGAIGDKSLANYAVVRACTPDAQRFCSAVIRDAAARGGACMQQHRAELSRGGRDTRRKCWPAICTLEIG